LGRVDFSNLFIDLSGRGFRTLTDFALVVYTHSGNYARTCAATVLAEGFNQLSPTCYIEVRSVPFRDIIDLMYHSRCPVAWLGWSAEYPHPYSFASQLLAPSSLLVRRLGLDFPYIASLIDRARTILDEQESAAVYQAIAREAIREITHIFVPGKLDYLAYSSRWTNVRYRKGVTSTLDFTSFRNRDIKC